MNFIQHGRLANATPTNREIVAFADIAKELAPFLTAKPTVVLKNTGNLVLRIPYKRTTLVEGADPVEQACVFTISCSNSVKAEILASEFKTGNEALLHCVKSYQVQVLHENYVTGEAYNENVYKFSVPVANAEEVDFGALLGLKAGTGGVPMNPSLVGA